MMKTIVVKVGSSTLSDSQARLSKPNILELVRQIASLHQAGHRMILVSSGAAAAGRQHLGYPKLPPSLPVKQMLCAVGQSQLMHIYSEMFAYYDVTVGQVLVTGDDLRRNRARYLNTRDTLLMLLDHQIVPIINENDTVAVDEIKVGDNDNLSALIASLLNADWLILLTDRDGLYDKDPRHHEDAKRIEHISRITSEIRRIAGGESSSGLGTGGMQTKLQAAEIAGQSGIQTIIAHGKTPNVLQRLVDGETLGTVFSPPLPRTESRKRWMIAEPVKGILTVDEGAAKALRQGDASLLPVGIKSVQGEFERGEFVQVEDLKREAIARGQTRYSSTELTQLCGVKSAKIVEILGYSYGDAAVHHDDMVLLQPVEA